MKLLECLKVLALLQENKKLNIERICRKTDLSKKKVKLALNYLQESSVISQHGSRVKINVKKIG